MSSSESENENLQNLLEAADTTLTKNLFHLGYKCTQTKRPGEIKRFRSMRYIVEEDSPNQSDVTVNESMKFYFYKKLSSMIEKQISFVDMKTHAPFEPKFTKTRGIKLFKDSKTIVEFSNKDNTYVEKKTYESKFYIDNSNEIEMAVIEADCLLRNLKRALTSRRRLCIFEYKLEQSMFVLQYPQNEFAECRQKYQWNESDIKYFRKKKS